MKTITLIVQETCNFGHSRIGCPMEAKVSEDVFLELISEEMEGESNTPVYRNGRQIDNVLYYNVETCEICQTAQDIWELVNKEHKWTDVHGWRHERKMKEVVMPVRVLRATKSKSGDVYEYDPSVRYNY